MTPYSRSLARAPIALLVLAIACARAPESPRPAPAVAAPETSPNAARPSQGAESPAQALARQMAQQAATAWLALVDVADYTGSWDSASVSFRQAVTRQRWREAVMDARSPFEPFGARRLIGSQYRHSLPNAPPGEYVVLEYETDVSGGRKVTEMVVPARDPDGRWRVSGYFVRPRS